MAQFVNYKKRSFTLPPGCKDFIDVLEPSSRAIKGTVVSTGFQRPQVNEVANLLGRRFLNRESLRGPLPDGFAQLGRLLARFVHLFAERIQAGFRLAAHPFRKRLKLLDLTADGGVPMGGKSVFGGGLPGPQKGLQTGQNGGEETDNTGAPLQIRGQL